MNKKKVLYIVWAVLYCTCFGLSFVNNPTPGEKAFLTGLSVVFFIPPFWLWFLSRKENHHKTTRILRWISFGSLVLTLLFFIAALLTIRSPHWLQILVTVLLRLVSVPLETSHTWALSLYFWALLMILTLPKRHPGRK